MATNLLHPFLSGLPLFVQLTSNLVQHAPLTGCKLNFLSVGHTMCLTVIGRDGRLIGCVKSDMDADALKAAIKGIKRILIKSRNLYESSCEQSHVRSGTVGDKCGTLDENPDAEHLAIAAPEFDQQQWEDHFDAMWARCRPKPFNE